MNHRRLSLTVLAAACLAATVGCSSPQTTQAWSTDRTGRASMVAADQIGADIFADDTAIAGNFTPYAGRFDGPAQAAFVNGSTTTFAGVRTD